MEVVASSNSPSSVSDSFDAREERTTSLEGFGCCRPVLHYTEVWENPGAARWTESMESLPCAFVADDRVSMEFTWLKLRSSHDSGFPPFGVHSPAKGEEQSPQGGCHLIGFHGR